MDNEVRSSLATRPTLLFRLRDWQDTTSWEEFYGLYEKLVYGFARRGGLTHEEAEEVVQDVFKRVAETVHEFESNPARGSFRGWLMNLTRWRITDKFRERRRQSGSAPMVGRVDDTATDAIEQIPDDDTFTREFEGEWQQHVLKAALARLARRTPARHYQAFELSVQQHWSAVKIASALGLNLATVYVITHRLTKQLKKEVDQLQKTLQ